MCGPREPHTLMRRRTPPLPRASCAWAEIALASPHPTQEQASCACAPTRGQQDVERVCSYREGPEHLHGLEQRSASRATSPLLRDHRVQDPPGPLRLLPRARKSTCARTACTHGGEAAGLARGKGQNYAGGGGALARTARTKRVRVHTGGQASALSFSTTPAGTPATPLLAGDGGGRLARAVRPDARLRPWVG